jgi:hypothetical protein
VILNKQTNKHTHTHTQGGKAVPANAMKAQEEKGGTTPLILNLSTRRRLGSNSRYTRLKGEVHPGTVHEGPEREYRYSSTFSLTSALDGVGRQRQP